MKYVDSSVGLARIFAENRRPNEEFWSESIVSSRLFEYEMWSRIHALGLARTHGEAAHQILHHVSLVEMNPNVLARVLDPYPLPVRTLDALHLATVEWLREQGETVLLASYDSRMNAVARALGIPLADLD
jgi:hypothetical protein